MHEDQRHKHLWTLPDGTGLHAPPGRLVHDGDDRLCCHLCGHWFAALGPHLRTHGYTAAAYRMTMDLGLATPLVARRVSRALSRRQAAAYRDDPEFRDRLVPGQRMARDGRLARCARDSLLFGPRPAERVRVRNTALEVGRRTRAQRRAETLERRLTASGAPSLAEFLRREYERGASLAELARSTGLGRARLRHAMDAATITVRSTGATTPAGRRSRAVEADAAAAASVGTDDIVRWLDEHRTAGWSLIRLARSVGHSTQWVKWRLERRSDGA